MRTEQQIQHDAAMVTAIKHLQAQRDELAAALRDCAAQCDAMLNGQAMPDADELDAALLAARAALAKVSG